MVFTMSMGINEIIISNPPTSNIKVIKTTKPLIMKSTAGIVIDDSKYSKKQLSKNTYILNSGLLEFYDKILRSITRTLRGVATRRTFEKQGFNETIKILEQQLPEIMYNINNILKEEFNSKECRIKLIYNLYDMNIPILDSSPKTGPYLTLIINYDGEKITKFYIGIDLISNIRIQYTDIKMTTDTRYSIYIETKKTGGKPKIKKTGPILIVNFIKTNQ